MQKLGDILINYFFEVRNFFGDIITPLLPWLEFFALIISGLLIWGIIYCSVRSGYLNKQADILIDSLGIGDVGRRRQLRAWKKIVKYLKSREMEDWKKAIIEADAIFDEILKMSGYRGATVHDRFKQLLPSAISNHEKILASHKVRDRVLQEPDFILSREEAIEVIKVYERAFRELGLLD